MCTFVFHVIMSASVFNTFLVRKALLHSQQPMVQNKAAEETNRASFVKLMYAIKNKSPHLNAEDRACHKPHYPSLLAPVIKHE